MATTYQSQTGFYTPSTVGPNYPRPSPVDFPPLQRWAPIRSAGGGRQPQPGRPGQGSYGFSEAGEYLDPDQQRRVNELYPQLLNSLLGIQNRPANLPAFAQLLETVGGPPVQFGAPNPALATGYQYGPAFDFGQGTQYGQPAAYPEISTSPIWNDQQLQERVNLSRQLANQRTDEWRYEMEGARAGTGAVRGRGESRQLGGDLGLLSQMVTDAANTQSENMLRWEAAQGNAQHVLAAQQAAVDRAARLGEEGFQRQRATDESDFRRRAALAGESFGREQASAQDILARLGLQENSALQRLQMSSQHDLDRRRLALQSQAQDMQNSSNREAAILQALTSMNRPRQRSRQQQESWVEEQRQPSGPPRMGIVTRFGLV